MEYVLAGVFKEQLGKARMLRGIPGTHILFSISELHICIFLSELNLVLHQGHLICNEMFHFVQQVQYYLNFEVGWTVIQWNENLYFTHLGA
jgi:hypothetical protein